MMYSVPDKSGLQDYPHVGSSPRRAITSRRGTLKGSAAARTQSPLSSPLPAWCHLTDPAGRRSTFAPQVPPTSPSTDGRVRTIAQRMPHLLRQGLYLDGGATLDVIGRDDDILQRLREYA